MLSFLIDYIRFSAETTVATLILSIGITPRPRKGLRWALSAMILAGSCLLLARIRVLDLPLPGIAKDTLIYLVLSLLPFGISCLVYRSALWDRIFSLINGAMLRMCARKLFDAAVTLLAQNPSAEAALLRGQPLRYILYYGIMAALFTAAWFLLGKTYRKGRNFGGYGVTAVYLIVLVINLILNRLEPVLESVSLSYYVELVLCEAAYYALMLVMQLVMFRMVLHREETATTRALWHKDRQQYEQMKENIETINIKCHDLRHHIREIQSDDRKEGGYLEEVARSISIYDSLTKTGNDALDVVLTEKKLRAESAGIQMTVMADGGAVRMMEETDIYSLFGNLLDNAIEYESGIESEEKRYISLQIKEQLGYASLHLENYFEGTLRLEDGLPVTTKADKTLHGYGMKSIRQTVEKYSGVMTVDAEDSIFFVQILIPLPRP